MNCPICELQLNKPIPVICIKCGWDLKNDLSLHLSMEIPDDVMSAYHERVMIARRNWMERVEAISRQQEAEAELRRLKEQQHMDEERRTLEEQARLDAQRRELEAQQKREAEAARRQREQEEKKRAEAARKVQEEQERVAANRRKLEQECAKIKAPIQSGNNKRFKIINDDIIEDADTGLCWSKCIGPRLKYNEAKKWIENQTYGNYHDWRMPTSVELLSLLDKKQYNPSLPPNHPFIIDPEDQRKPEIWSSSECNMGHYAISYWYPEFGFYNESFKVAKQFGLTNGYCYTWLVRKRMRFFKKINTYMALELPPFLGFAGVILLGSLIISLIFAALKLLWDYVIGRIF